MRALFFWQKVWLLIRLREILIKYIFVYFIYKNILTCDMVVDQNAEVVDFSANGITEIGVKALSDVLPTNTFMKTLNFSGNSFGDDGAKVNFYLTE